MSEQKKEDLRVVKTKKNIRAAFLRAAEEKRPEEMKVSELAKDAEIARKTVYLHYRNVEDIEDDVCDQETQKIIPQLTGEMASDIETLYEFFDEADDGIIKLLFGGGHHQICEEILPSDILVRGFQEMV